MPILGIFNVKETSINKSRLSKEPWGDWGWSNWPGSAGPCEDSSLGECMSIPQCFCRAALELKPGPSLQGIARRLELAQGSLSSEAEVNRGCAGSFLSAQPDPTPGLALSATALGTKPLSSCIPQELAYKSQPDWSLVQALGHRQRLQQWEAAHRVTLDLAALKNLEEPRKSFPWQAYHVTLRDTQLNDGPTVKAYLSAFTFTRSYSAYSTTSINCIVLDMLDCSILYDTLLSDKGFEDKQKRKVLSLKHPKHFKIPLESWVYDTNYRNWKTELFNS